MFLHIQITNEIALMMKHTIYLLLNFKLISKSSKVTPNLRFIINSAKKKITFKYNQNNYTLCYFIFIYKYIINEKIFCRILIKNKKNF